MKVSISYFYQIRYFRPEMIPVSTAKWDPKWYSPIHIDNNGVINGLRLPELSPGGSCDGLCKGKPCSEDPKTCKFLKEYKHQFDSLNFNSVYRRLSIIAEYAKNILSLPYNVEPHIVLMVYEAPNNPCSERDAIIEFFTKNGISCEELKLK